MDPTSDVDTEGHGLSGPGVLEPLPILRWVTPEVSVDQK